MKTRCLQTQIFLNTFCSIPSVGGSATRRRCLPNLPPTAVRLQVVREGRDARGSGDLNFEAKHQALGHSVKLFPLWTPEPRRCV